MGLPRYMRLQSYCAGDQTEREAKLGIHWFMVRIKLFSVRVIYIFKIKCTPIKNYSSKKIL